MSEDGERRARAVINGKPSVLIANGRKDLRELYSYALAREGFEVFAAEDGSEAVEKSVEVAADIVILDFNMRKTNGPDAAVEMILKRPESKILMLTSDEREMEEAKGIKAVHAFLVTPFSLKRFIEAVSVLSTTEKVGRS